MAELAKTIHVLDRMATVIGNFKIQIPKYTWQSSLPPTAKYVLKKEHFGFLEGRYCIDRPFAIMGKVGKLWEYVHHLKAGIIHNVLLVYYESIFMVKMNRACFCVCRFYFNRPLWETVIIPSEYGQPNVTTVNHCEGQ
jgi:hypothetical protein